MANYSIYSLRENKTFFSIYCTLTTFYSQTTALLENIFLRSNSCDQLFLRKGIFKLKSKKNFSDILAKYKEPCIDKKSSVIAISDKNFAFDKVYL